MSFTSPSISKKRPKNVNSNNNNLNLNSSVNMNSSPSKKRRSNILSLNESFKAYLFTIIPLLNENLLKLIITYSNSQNEFEKKESLRNITKKLRLAHKLGNLDPFNNALNKAYKQNNKYIKSYVFRANGLIEGIIHTALCYLTRDLDKHISSINIIQKLNNRLHETMNIAPGLSLEEYTMNLFNSDADNKEELMIYVLIKIAQNLLELQNRCGFIHGDLNEQNIFINKFDGSILFIDFGMSTCRIPTSNGRYFILSMPVSENLSYKHTLDINEDVRLKSIDLFYLVEKLSRFRKDSFENYKQFISIINEIKGNMKVNSSKELFEFVYTDSFLGNPIVKNFYPENFINNLGTLLAGNPGSPATPPI